MPEKCHDTAEDVEIAAVKELGFSLSDICSLQESIDNCHELLKSYLETIPPSGSIHQRLVKLAMDSDQLLLESIELKVHATKLLRAVKQKTQAKQAVKINKDEAKKVLKRLETAEEATKRLASGIKSFIKEVTIDE